MGMETIPNSSLEDTPPADESSTADITTPESKDNSGQEADLTSFWEEADGESNAEQDASKSVTLNDPSASTPSVSNPMEAIDGVMNNLSFDSIFTPDLLTDMAEGNMEAINKVLTQGNRAAVKHSLILTANMLNQLQNSMTQKFEQLIESKLQAGKAETDLFAGLPFTSKPQFQPLAKGVYAQALKRSNGDGAKALKVTEAFFKSMAQESANDLNLQLAPIGQDASNNETGEDIDWLDQLVGR